DREKKWYGVGRFVGFVREREKVGKGIGWKWMRRALEGVGGRVVYEEGLEEKVGVKIDDISLCGCKMECEA
uniref:hypothetical protein n=1 Tax=Bacillus sp. WP8 TaxID=756828 RepID=UPI001642E41E